MAGPGKHPDDPAEGSRETIERELARQTDDGKGEARLERIQDVKGTTKQGVEHNEKPATPSTGASPQPGPGDEIRAEQAKRAAGNQSE